MKFKLFIASFVLSAAVVSLYGQSNISAVDYRVIPLPQKIVLDEGHKPFVINKKTIIRYVKGNDKLKKNAQFLSSYISEMTGLKLKVKEGLSSSGINLKVGGYTGNNEGYRLDVNSKKIDINGASEAGVFYGIQTLRKSLSSVKGKSAIDMPAVSIEDYPRFAYRGAMLDVGRHFFSVDSVKRYIDMLALHNVNRFHWHLSEDLGWRIEIKSRPKLTSIGSKRKETVIGHNTGKYDGIPYGGFYTQEQAKDIVKYAADRNITVIPEIDMPGHMQAALAAYPELGCTGGPYEVLTKWGISDNVLCAGNDATLKFIEDVLGEIIQIFPSEYIHIGGDECPKTKWKECPKCQQRIKDLGIVADSKHTAEQKLQSFIMTYAEKFLNSKGRKIIGWDEILEGGLAPNATVMSWRGERGGIEAARQHHDVIMSPNTYLYFDYYQSKNIKKEPMAIGGYLPLEKVYSYEPMPNALSSEEQKYIKGVQANLWTEYIPTFSQAEYMALPRVAALCEIQWSNPAQKNYIDFLSRLVKLLNIYNIKEYNYSTRFNDIAGFFSPDLEKGKMIVTLSAVNNPPIYYTLDGTCPTLKSTLYTSPLSLDKSAVIKALVIGGNMKNPMFEEKLDFNKASLKPITMLQPINEKYMYNGASTLVDGIRGENNFKSGKWIGFCHNDMEAVIDLKKEDSISKVAFSTYVSKGDWIFDVRSAEVYISDDGKDYKKIVQKDYPVLKNEDRNGVYEHEISFDTCNARYIKIKLAPEYHMPGWHVGSGKSAFIFVDEIQIL